MEAFKMFLEGLLNEQELFSVLEENALYGCGDVGEVLAQMDQNQRARFQTWQQGRMAKAPTANRDAIAA